MVIDPSAALAQSAELLRPGGFGVVVGTDGRFDHFGIDRPLWRDLFPVVHELPLAYNAQKSDEFCNFDSEVSILMVE